jgi:23S rRNA (cytosine1962-C5)-methyltransferase
MATRERGGSTRRRKVDRPIVRRGTVRLQHDVARRIRLGHPWVYREALGSRPLREQPGAPIDLVDWDGEFVGRGVFDGDSAIAVRVLTRDPEERVDDALFRGRVRAAIAARRRVLDWDALESMRLVNGEADGLPGIVVERYGRYLVTQIFTPAIEGMRDAIYDALEAELNPAAIYEQRRFRPLAGEAPRAAELIRGAPAPVEIEVHEDQLKFWVDVTAPLSTGLFADLREGRRAVAHWSRGRRVLNLFSYTGALSVYAAHGQASEIAAVDVAAKAHARARRNFALNGFDPEKPDHIVGDTFKVLARFADRGRTFDMVVIDPPAFASGSRGGNVWSAVKDYSELVSASLQVLAPGGLLMAASSTRKVTQLEFDTALAEGAMLAHADLRIIERRSLPPDFPTLPGFPEGNYLKLVVCMRD